MSNNTPVKGYKAFDLNLKCIEMQFKVGKTYKSDALAMCSAGFHFCESFYSVYGYYAKSSSTRICEVEALGKVLKEGDKSCTDELKVVRELTKEEIIDLIFKQKNSGDRNSGYGNSGYGNSGNGNSGNWNSGYGNSGNWNSGNWNSGYGNSGNGNSGNWNSGNGNSGFFNSVETPVIMFNKPTDFKWTQEFENRTRTLNVKPVLEWISEDSMTEAEKAANPSSKTTGGFLRKTERYDWRGLTEADKEFIRNLPNFDDAVFQKISGISIAKPKTIKVTVEGREIEIDLEKAKELGLIKE